MRAQVVLALLALTSTASAEISDDGYCDHVEGVANAQAAVEFSPQLIGAVGCFEQQPAAINPDVSEKGVRLIAGGRYKLSGIYEGLATRGRAKADCRRHRAFEQVRGETASRAIAARLKVLDDALREAERMLKTDEADFAARRMTAQEAGRWGVSPGTGVAAFFASLRLRRTDEKRYSNPVFLLSYAVPSPGQT